MMQFSRTKAGKMHTVIICSKCKKDTVTNSMEEKGKVICYECGAVDFPGYFKNMLCKFCKGRGAYLESEKETNYQVVSRWCCLECNRINRHYATKNWRSYT